MSKYAQIEIRVLPAYGTGGLKGAFPNLYGTLAKFGYDLVIKREPSLYEMVEVLVRIRNDPHVPDNAKKPIAIALDHIVKLRDDALEFLLARRLDELDRLLYRLEDLFSDLEYALG
ncbi:MAG: hypothetical protein ABFD97_05720 [Syntrophobacter sp.]